MHIGRGSPTPIATACGTPSPPGAWRRGWIRSFVSCVLSFYLYFLGVTYTKRRRPVRSSRIGTASFFTDIQGFQTAQKDRVQPALLCSALLCSALLCSAVSVSRSVTVCQPLFRHNFYLVYHIFWDLERLFLCYSR